MSISNQIARSPNLVVHDPHYTWAGQTDLTLKSGPLRLVQVNLDAPAVLSWAVVLLNNAPSVHYDATNFCRVKVSTGVSRAFTAATADLLGAFTGQVLAQTLQISIEPRANLINPPPDTVQAVCLVTRGTAPVVAWPSSARLRNLGDVGGDSAGIAAAWRRGMSVHNNTDPTTAADVNVRIPQNLDGTGRVNGQYTIAPGETLTLADYCGPVEVQTGFVGVLYASAAIAEW